MLLQPYNSYLIIATIKEVDAHEAKSHWTLMKESEVNNNHTNKYGKLKTSLSTWSFKHNILLDGILMNNKSILSTHRGMQQWGVNYRKNYPPLSNWISVSSLLAITIIHE